MAQTALEEVVRKAVAALLRPWLDDTASRFQKAEASSGLPTTAEQGAITAEPGEVLLSADGLRYDVARQLQKELEAMGITGGTGNHRDQLEGPALQPGGQRSHRWLEG